MCEGYMGRREPSRLPWELGENVNDATDTDRLPYMGRSMMSDYYGREDSYDLDNGRTLTVWERRRERTLLGKLLLGKHATKHVCVVDLAEKPIKGQRHYMQIAVTDLRPSPEVSEGIRGADEKMAYDSVMRLFERQEGIAEPTEEQIAVITSALDEAANCHPKFDDDWA